MCICGMLSHLDVNPASKLILLIWVDQIQSLSESMVRFGIATVKERVHLLKGGGVERVVVIVACLSQLWLRKPQQKTPFSNDHPPSNNLI